MFRLITSPAAGWGQGTEPVFVKLGLQVPHHIAAAAAAPGRGFTRDTVCVIVRSTRAWPSLGQFDSERPQAAGSRGRPVETGVMPALWENDVIFPCRQATREFRARSPRVYARRCRVNPERRAESNDVRVSGHGDMLRKRPLRAASISTALRKHRPR